MRSLLQGGIKFFESALTLGRGALVIGAFALGAPNSPAFADAVTVSVDIPVSGEPRTVTGIALGATLELISSVSLKRFSSETLTATFDVPEKSTAVLAMAELTDGTTVFGDTRLVSAAQALAPLASIPGCSVVGAIKADASQRGLMQSLVEIRTARRDVLKNRLRASLSEASLEKARKLEDLFGLKRAEPLSLDMAPTDLIDRLTRLSAAIKSYRNVREAQQVAETGAGQKEQTTNKASTKDSPQRSAQGATTERK